MKKLVLASASPRRKQLLEWAGLDFDVIVAATDETFPDALTPAAAAMHIASQKALAVQSGGDYLAHHSSQPVLAADTIVVCDGKIIGKPADRNDAILMLQFLSGKRHEVVTGVTIVNGHQTHRFADTTEVWFHQLTTEQIEFYVDRYQPFDKAGAYAIQEWIGIVGIERIQGDYYNVMGLPVSRVVRELEKMRCI